MYVVDASVWASRFIDSDTHYAISEKWLSQKLEEDIRIFVPLLLLPEVAGAVARRTRSSRLGEQAADSILRLGKIQLIALDEEGARQSASMAAVSHLKGSDAVYVALAQQLEVPLITWDREQQERGGRLVEVRVPAIA